jgi:hypothetical protein
VRPIDFCVGSDVADDVPAHPVAGCKLIKNAPAARRGADCSNVILSQFGVPIAGTADTFGEAVKATVPNGISHILSPRSPSQVFRPVVRAAPISVSNIVSAFWGWAVERLADKTMNLGGLLLTRNLQPDKRVAPSASVIGLSNQPRFCVSDTPLTRGFILGAGRYRLPFFRHKKAPY